MGLIGRSPWRAIVLMPALTAATAMACASSADSAPTPAAVTEPGGPLSADTFNDGVFCDGTERPAAVIFGAEPGETITFTSPMPVDVADGSADDDGTHQLFWSCEPNEAGLSWELTATGSASGRSARFRINGSYRDPDLGLVFTPAEQPMTCDGTSRAVGRLDNAEPDEIVDFSADDVDGLRTGVADGLGTVIVNWRCEPEESDRTWTVEAVGRRSGRAALIDITGRLPEPADAGPIQVELLEDPVVCNRERRVVAVLRNLTPGVPVEFAASPADQPLRPGRAGRDGSLDVHWQCRRDQADTVWTIEATEQVSSPGTEARSATIVLTGSPSADPTSIVVEEDPFTCDGTSHRFAVLSNFLPGEYIDFSSPQSDAIGQVQADGEGTVPIRWQCSPDDAGRQWEVTADGLTSGYSLTFTISGE